MPTQMPDFTVKHVDQPDEPTASAQEMKELFDARGNEIRAWLNTVLGPLIDEHLAEKAADDVHGLLTDGKIIEESGSNSNGEYVRFADGTQICYVHGLTGSAKENADKVVAFTWTFPSEFFDENYAGCGFRIVDDADATRSRRTLASFNPATSGFALVRIYDPESTFPETADFYHAHALAIGRWK